MASSSAVSYSAAITALKGIAFPKMPQEALIIFFSGHKPLYLPAFPLLYRDLFSLMFPFFQLSVNPLVFSKTFSAVKYSMRDKRGLNKIYLPKGRKEDF